jgi:hypothetical protein
MEKVTALQTNATLARDWLLQMGRGAQKNGLSIQYCMAWARHLLQSLESPAVTQSRASNDYHPASLTENQWTIGVTSILLDAIGLRPSKDNYQSRVSEPGNPKMSGTSTVRVARCRMHASMHADQLLTHHLVIV